VGDDVVAHKSAVASELVGGGKRRRTIATNLERYRAVEASRRDGASAVASVQTQYAAHLSIRLDIVATERSQE